MEMRIFIIKNNVMEQPFFIGQKVVCVEVIYDSEPGIDDLIKGNTYTINAVEPHRYINGDWAVSVNEVSDPTDKYHHSQFAPIHPAHSDVTKELARDAQPETLDVIKQKVLS